jgi:hypothetical protein
MVKDPPHSSALPVSSGALMLAKKESRISRFVTSGRCHFLPLFAVGSAPPPLAAVRIGNANKKW